MTTIAIVPARGGSKRLRNKNATNVAGVPLCAWTIYAALSSRCDRVIVSTEDASIAAIARRCGGRVEIHDRPADLATDTATTESVMAHVLSTMGGNWTHAVLLQPTSPLRTAKRIDEAMAILLADPTLDTVIGVYRDPGAMFTWAPGHVGNIVNNFEERPRTQDIHDLRENGSIYAFTRASWERTGNRFGSWVKPLIMDGWESIDCDSYDDLRVAEYWLWVQLQRRNDEFRRHLDAWCGEEKGT